MNFITRITIPIGDYYGENVFYKQYYFQCKNNSPTKKQVINVIEKLDNEYKQYLDYIGEDYEALGIIKLIPDEDWQFVSPYNLVCTNTFVEHPKFGRQPLNWDIINLIDVES